MAPRMTSAAVVRRALAGIALAALSGCLEWSPHALPSDPDERDLNRKAIERILATPVEQLRFVAVGDTQRSFDEAEDFVEAVNRRDDVQFVVQLGDFTNVGLLLEFREMNRIFRRLRVPYLVLAGNHDHFGNGIEIYRHMFGPENFAFTHGGVRFVFFDSASVSHDFDGTVPDLGWIEGQLAPAPDHDRALTFAHIAPGGGSLFDESLTEPLRSLLSLEPVDLSLHAHAHRFEAYEHAGVRYVIADSVDHRSYLLVVQRPDGGFDFERVEF